jgi:hypothetical protein
MLLEKQSESFVGMKKFPGIFRKTSLQIIEKSPDIFARPLFQGKAMPEFSQGLCPLHVRRCDFFVHLLAYQDLKQSGSGFRVPFPSGFDIVMIFVYHFLMIREGFFYFNIKYYQNH